MVLDYSPVGKDIPKSMLEFAISTDNDLGYRPRTRYLNWMRAAVIGDSIMAAGISKKGKMGQRPSGPLHGAGLTWSPMPVGVAGGAGWGSRSADGSHAFVGAQHELRDRMP